MVTRRDLPLRLHKLRLAGELAEIRAAQLRFTEHETRQLLAAAGIALPERMAAMLHQRTEGWAAGLRLAVLSLAGHPDPERFVAEFSGSDRTVAEYLMAEMLERQPPEVQGLLLRTSVLDRVDGELADLLTGATGSERILLDLEDANAFVVSLDPGRTWFRYHRMFGGLLRLELRRTMPADIPGLHRLAARWLAEHGQAAEAIGHLQAAGDWDEAARMLTDHALSLTLDGQAGTVAALLRSFRPGAAKIPDPSLLQAIADQYQLRLDQTDAYLREVRAYAATAPPAADGLEMAIASVDLLSARLRGGLRRHLRAGRGLLCPADGQTSADAALGSDLKAVALLNRGVTEAWSLRLADSERHLAEGAALACRIGLPAPGGGLSGPAGFAATGRSSALARQRREEAIALAARQGWDAEPGSPSAGGLANALVWTGRSTSRNTGWTAPGAPLRPTEPGIWPPGATPRSSRRAWSLPPGAGEFAAAGRCRRSWWASTGWISARRPGRSPPRPGWGWPGRRGLLRPPSTPAGQRGRDPQRGRGDPAGQQDPAAARRELRAVLDGYRPRPFLPHPGRGAPAGRAPLPRPG